MSLWTSEEAVAATGGRSVGHWVASGVSIDTRTLQEGDLFIALKDVRDGHDFVAAALEKGACAAMVSYRPEGIAEDAPLLIVDDALQGLERLGTAARARTAARVIGVTGSVGKTSTKEMLREMLAPQGKTHASLASYNNHWGVPLTLARMPADTEFAIIEMGMNHPGEIAPLSKMVRPHVALVTIVGAAHLEAFEDENGIAREKASIIDGLEQGGQAVFNADIPTQEAMARYADAKGITPIWFGAKASEAHLLEVIVGAVETQAKAEVSGAAYEMQINSAGAHFAMNALGALAAVEALGADPLQAARDIANWSPVVGRGARVDVTLHDGRKIDLIDDAYNANPTSMRAALAVLGASPSKRRVAILGDMKELGPTARDIHASIASWAEIENVERVHTIGQDMAALDAALAETQRGEYRQTPEEFLLLLESILKDGDTVLVKSSLSSKLGQVVDAIKNMGQASA
jgi:UDP-N-acetylmuramoyl-tripeptide--D-alanyl-D-alanine ligase